jgi:hypothetical protein
MAKSKHHYVPQFYLRNFASSTSRKQIHVYNLPHRLPLESVSLEGVMDFYKLGLCPVKPIPAM